MKSLVEFIAESLYKIDNIDVYSVINKVINTKNYPVLKEHFEDEIDEFIFLDAIINKLELEQIFLNNQYLKKILEKMSLMPIFIDDLIRDTGESVTAVISALSAMKTKGIVTEPMSGFYQIALAYKNDL